MAADEETLAVVHLVRAGNPSGSYERFLNSYRRHNAGADHQFVLLLKGFGDNEELEAVRQAAADIPSHEVHIPDDGFDLRAYFELVRQTRHDVLCFLNSFSVIQADGWLGRLAAAIRTPGIGLAGATGSWASPRSHTLYELGFPSAYAKIFDDRRRFREQFALLASSPSTPTEPGVSQPLARRGGFALHVLAQLRYFAGFPSPHIRTNGFVARRETLAAVRTGPLLTKRDNYQLESGRRGLTAQVAAMGLRTVVCGADGSAVDPPYWPTVAGFRQGDQTNLLVADNQTEAFDQGDAELRLVLSRSAWGRDAHPERFSDRARV